MVELLEVALLGRGQILDKKTRQMRDESYLPCF